MRLGIDLRFYLPQPYGLAVHIRDLMTELVPLLEQQKTFDTVVLIFHKELELLSVEKLPEWWHRVCSHQKFEVVFSDVRHYTVAEQTYFLAFLLGLNLDLIYFFTFNFPLLYPRPFVYQVLDLSLPKTRSHLSVQLQAMLLCIRVGVRRARHVLFLGNNSRVDCEKYAWINTHNVHSRGYIPNTVIYNGVNPLYLTQPHTLKERSQIVGVPYSAAQQTALQSMKAQLGINKPYFLFISVWRKYKNVVRLVDAFNRFNAHHHDAYQLVLAGKQDPKYPEISTYVKSTKQYREGNILITGPIDRDEDVIMLYDDAEAMIAPSLSEGFGLWMVEAAVRGCPVLCSNIDIFHEIAGDNAFFFDPYSVDDIVRTLEVFAATTSHERAHVSRQLFEKTAMFRWSAVSTQVMSVLEQAAQAR